MTEVDKYTQAIGQWLIEREPHLQDKGFKSHHIVSVNFDTEVDYSGCPTCGDDYSPSIEYVFSHGDKNFYGDHVLKNNKVGAFVKEVSEIIQAMEQQ